MTACWHDWFPFQAGSCIVTGLGLLPDPLSLSDPHGLIGCHVQTRYLVSGVEPRLPLEQFKLLTSRLHLHPLSYRTDHRRQRIRCTVQSEIRKRPGIRIRKVRSKLPESPIPLARLPANHRRSRSSGSRNIRWSDWLLTFPYRTSLIGHNQLGCCHWLQSPRSWTLVRPIEPCTVSTGAGLIPGLGRRQETASIELVMIR